MDTIRSMDTREERAWRSLHFMQARIEGEVARRLASDAGLSYPDYLVLTALADRPDGRARVFELAAKLGWEKSRLSHHIGRMTDRELVTKEKCDSDRRGSWVAITTRGRRAITAAAPSHAEAIRCLFADRLTPRQLDAIAAAAESVLAALDEPDSVTDRERP